MTAIVFFAVLIVGTTLGVMASLVVMTRQPRTKMDWLALITMNVGAWPAIVSFAGAFLLVMGLVSARDRIQFRLGV